MMLPKYYLIVPLMVRVSAALLSATNETSETHQKDIQKGVQKNDQKDLQNHFQKDPQKNPQIDPQNNSPIPGANPHVNGLSSADSNKSSEDSCKCICSDSARRCKKHVLLPLSYEGADYYADIYVGSVPERLKAQITLNVPDTWVIRVRSYCSPNEKRQVQSEEINSKVDYSNDLQSPSSNLVGKKKDEKSGSTKTSEAGNGIHIPRYMGHQNKKRATTCRTYGYNPGASSSLWKRPSLGFYDDPRLGLWAHDKVKVADATCRMSFGVTNIESDTHGLLGLGNPKNSRRWWNSEEYVNFPMGLKQSGHINRLTYAFLHGGDKVNSSILFGAVDNAKYLGKLQTVPIVYSERATPNAPLSVVLSNIYLEGSDGRKVTILNEPISAEFELGGHAQIWDREIFHRLIQSISGEIWSGVRPYQINCGFIHANRTLIYDFSGILIRVPFSRLIKKASNEVCYLDISPPHLDNDRDHVYESFPHVHLPNSFLQSVYFVVDWDRREVSMAQAKVTQEEDIEEVVYSVPRASKAERYSSTSLTSRLNRKFRVAISLLDSNSTVP